MLLIPIRHIPPLINKALLITPPELAGLNHAKKLIRILHVPLRPRDELALLAPSLFRERVQIHRDLRRIVAVPEIRLGAPDDEVVLVVDGLFEGVGGRARDVGYGARGDTREVHS